MRRDEMTSWESTRETHVRWMVRVLAVVLLPAALFGGATRSLASAGTTGATGIIGALPSIQLPDTVEEIDRSIAELELRRAEVENRLEEQREDTGPDGQAAAGASPGDHEETRRLLFRWKIAIEGEQRSLIRWKSVRQSRIDRAAESGAWHGFSQTPPYPQRMIERLRDAVAAQKLELQALQVVVSIQEGEVARFAGLVSEDRKEERVALDTLDSLPEGGREAVRNLAELRARADESALRAAEVERLVQVEDLAGQRRYLEFLERKLQTAAADGRFDREDLDLELTAIRGKQEELAKDIARAVTAATEAQRLLDRARSVRRKEDAAPPTAGHEDRLARQAAEVEMRQTIADTSQLRIDMLRGLMQLSKTAEAQWNDRFWLTSTPGLAQIRDKKAVSADRMARLRAWSSFVESKLSMSIAQARSFAQRGALAGLDAKETDTARMSRDALQERASYYQQAQAALGVAISQEERLQSELADGEARITVAGRGRALFDTVQAAGRRVWGSELYIAEENVITDGRRIAIPRSVTVGKVLVALALFLTGLGLARLMYRLAHHTAWRWMRMGEHSASLWAKALAACVALGALLFAMTTVRIPWTVFAFLGGALAIGLGFGGQALISNFISGLILLFERRIRVRDLVEIDGERGHVARIGVRSSLIKRSDGVEMLVPNSRFLERNVVNWTLSDNLAQFSVSVGVSYGSPTSMVAEIIGQTAGADPRVLSKPAPVVLFQEFGERALVFTVRFWLRLDNDNDPLVVCSDLRHRIDSALLQSGIDLARPYGIVELGGPSRPPAQSQAS